MVAGQIVFTSFQLHSSIDEQGDSDLAIALADAEVEIFQLLACKMQRVESQLFFVYTSVASKKADIIARENNVIVNNVQSQDPTAV